MKTLILNIIIWIIPLAFIQGNTWEKSSLDVIKYSIFNRMTFRQPVVFTPFDVKVGYLYYGGKNYCQNHLIIHLISLLLIYQFY